ncbi:hypothetical protein [Mycolicibacterium holsaticum]|uniref:hypothetical protein n=1 Tax=Mycolicibacterium holsaticum TaxID=152142 RepID=UPI0027E2C948|nr:hypothetical protein [Mycolicibacterium holsaticum]
MECGPGLIRRELDTIAWAFLGSEFTGPAYRGWSIDRRLQAFLLHRGLTKLADDGNACNAILERVLSNLGPALRSGLIKPPGSPSRPNRAATRLAQSEENRHEGNGL